MRRTRPSASRRDTARSSTQCVSPEASRSRYSCMNSSCDVLKWRRRASLYPSTSSGWICATHHEFSLIDWPAPWPSISPSRSDRKTLSVTMFQSQMPSFMPRTARANRSSLCCSACSRRFSSVMSVHAEMIPPPAARRSLIWIHRPSDRCCSIVPSGERWRARRSAIKASMASGAVAYIPRVTASRSSSSKRMPGAIRSATSGNALP